MQSKPRVCRCSQLKLLKQHTIEKIRLSQQLEELKRQSLSIDSSALFDKSNPRNADHEKIVSSDMKSVESNEKKPLSRSKDSSLFNAAINSLPQITSNLFDNDENGRFEQENSEPVEDENQDKNSYEKMLKEPRRISKEQRYSLLFGNDFAAGYEEAHNENTHHLDDTLRKSSDVSDVLQESPEFIRYPFKRSSKEQRYSLLFNNDLNNGFESEVAKNIEGDKQIMVNNQDLDQRPKRMSREQRYSLLFNNDFAGSFDHGEDEQITKEQTTDIKSRKFDASYPKTHQVVAVKSKMSLKLPDITEQNEATYPAQNPNMTISCVSCKSDIKSGTNFQFPQHDAADKNSLQTILDDELSISIGSSILKTQKSPNVCCSCRKMYPDLFKKELVS